MAKKTSNQIIDLGVVQTTLKAYRAEIKTGRAALEKAYVELSKKDNDLYDLEDQARSLEHLINAGKALSKVKK